MQIIFDNNPDVTVEEMYTVAKDALQNPDSPWELRHVEALAELFTELANRLKVEEACGEQED